MKTLKTMINLVLLVCVGCSAMPAPGAATSAPTKAAAAVPMVSTTDPPAGMCAEVIAEKALHLRKGPSEKDIVLTWLFNGDVVQVISKRDPDWWRIDASGVTGYARAKYLKERECK